MTWTEAFRRAGTSTVPPELVRGQCPDRAPTTADDLALPERMDGDGPSVSVIVPTYGDGEYLPDALESVGSQTHRNLEVVLVDSSNVSWIRRLAEDRPWIRYRYREPAGVSVARNDGLSMADGTYAALLDADDYWHPEKLERQLDAMAEGGATSYTGQYFFKYWSNEEPELLAYDLDADQPEPAHVGLLRGDVTAHTSTLLFEQSVVPDRPFLESLHHFEDVTFAVELFREHPPRHVPEPLCVRRLREGSLSDRTDDGTAHEYKMAAYQHLADECPDLRPELDRVRAREAFERGWNCLESGRNAEARRRAIEGLRHRPLDARSLVLYAASVLPLPGSEVCELLESGYAAVKRRTGYGDAASGEGERTLRLGSDRFST